MLGIYVVEGMLLTLAPKAREIFRLLAQVYTFHTIFDIKIVIFIEFFSHYK